MIHEILIVFFPSTCSVTFLLFVIAIAFSGSVSALSLFEFNDFGRVELMGFLASAIYGFHYVLEELRF